MSTSTFKLTLLAALCCAALHPLCGQTPAKDQEAKLIAVLNSAADFNAKSDACRELAPIGTAAAVPALAALLGDDKLAHMARYGLEPIPGPAVDLALREALGKLKGRLQVGVIGSIGVRRDELAVAALVGLLNAPDAEVQQAAARALGAIGTAAAVTGLQAALPGASGAPQLALCEGLFRCAEGLTTKGQASQAIAIYDTLRKTPQLPHQVATGAWRGSILARQQDGLTLLLEALHSPDPGLATASLRIALECKAPDVSKTLADELGKLPPARQCQFASVLGKRGEAVALPALLALAKTGDPTARVAAIQAAIEIGNPAAVAPLIELSADPDAQVAKAAAAGLAGLPGSEVDTAVTGLLGSADDAVRKQMLDLVRQRRITAAMPILLKLMDDPNQATRANAITTYAELAGSAGFQPLLDKLLRSTEASDLNAVERALGAIGGAAGADAVESSSLLVAALTKASPAVKPALLRTLRITGGPAALTAVRNAVADADKAVHTAAIRVLGEWKTGDAAPILLDLAKSSAEPVDRILCLRGYLGMADRPDISKQAKMQICSESAKLVQRADEKLLLLGGLAKLADPEGIAVAAPYLDDPAVKREAVGAVIAMAEKRAPNQQSGVTRTALEKVLLVAADNPAMVKRAQELLQKLMTEK